MNTVEAKIKHGVGLDKSDFSDASQTQGARLDGVIKTDGAGIADYFTIQQAASFTKTVAQLREQSGLSNTDFSTMLGNSLASVDILQKQVGQIEDLGNSITAMFDKLSMANSEMTTDVVGKTAVLVENYEAVGRQIASLINTYGEYNAAVITLAATQQAQVASNLSAQVTSSSVVNPPIQNQDTTVSTALDATRSLLDILGVAVKNPYVQVGVMAAKLTIDIYELIDALNAETEAERKLREEQERKQTTTYWYLHSLAKELAEVDILFGKLKTLTVGTKEYNDTKNEIISGYGQYLQGLGDEITSLRDVEGAYKAISTAAVDAARKRAIADATSNAADQYAGVEISNLRNIRGQLNGMFDKNKATEYFNYIKNNLRDNTPVPENVKGDIEAKLRGKYKGQVAYGAGYSTLGGTEVFDHYIGKQLNIIKDAKIAMDNEIQDTTELLNGIFGNNGGLEGQVMNKAYWETQRKNAQDALEAMDGAKNGTKDWNAEQAKINQANSKLKQWDVSNKRNAEYDPKNEKDYTEELKKNDQNKIRRAKDLEFACTQAIIDTKKEGLEKTLAQNQHNYDIEIEQLRRQKEDRLTQLQDYERTKWESENPNWQKENKQFVPKIIALPDDELKSYSIIETNIGKKRYNLNKKPLEDLAAQYQTYADRRVAIEEKFDSDITTLKSKNEGGKYDAQIKQAENQKSEALSKIDFEEQKNGIDFTQLFGNLDNMTLPSMKSLREKIKVWIDGAAGTFLPEDLKAVSGAFNNLELKISDKDPFVVLKSSMKDYSDAAKEVRQAEDAVAVAQKNKANALDEESRATDRVIKAQHDLTQANNSNNVGDQVVSVANLVAAHGELSRATQNSVTATNVLIDAEKNLSGAQKDRATAVAAANSSLNNVGQIGQQAVGAAKDILGIMDDLGVKVPEEIAGAIDGVGMVMDGLSTIDLTQPMSIVTSSIKVIGGLVKSITSLFTGGKQVEAEMLKRKKEDLENTYLKELEISQLYRERYEWAKKIGESTLLHVQRQGAELERQNGVNQNNQQDLWAKLYSTDYKSGETIERNWIGKKQIKEERTSLSGKTWDEIEVLASTGKLSEEGMKYYEALKKAREEGEDITQRQLEYLESVRELTTGTTYDSVVNGIVEGFKAGKRSAADFSQSFEELMQGAVTSSLSMLADEKMRKWYEDFAEKGKDGYTQEEIDASKADYVKYLEQLDADAKALEQVTGIAIGGSKQREAAKRGIATASQESVDENNGRLTMIQDHTFTMNNNISLMTPNVESIKQSMDVIRENAAGQLTALHAIRDNTSPIAQMKAEMSLMRNDIGTMVLRGVKIIY